MHRKLIFAVSIFILAACNTITPSVATPTVQPTVTVQERLGTSTPKPTQLPTPSPVPSPTATPKERMDCLDISPNFTFSENSKGVVALAGINPGSSNFLLGMITGETMALANDRRDTAISPDHQFLVFHSGTKIKIISGDGKVIKTLPWDPSWREIASWISDDTLLISQKGEEIDSMVALNPWTGETRALLPDFPRVYQIYPYPHWGSGYATSQTFYTPTLDKVIYSPLPNKEYGELVLWNIKNQQEITRWRGSAYYVYPPQWSPTGDKFVINVQSEIKTLDSGLDQVKQDLFLVSNDGEFTPLTDFSSNYANVEIGNYSWSPNGQLIAFGVTLLPVQYSKDYNEIHIGDSYRPKDTHRLVILDTVSGEMTNYCIPAGSGLYAPVWSPDNNYVLVTDDYDHFSPSKYLVFIVDLQNRMASLLEKDVLPLGWLK